MHTNAPSNTASVAVLHPDNLRLVDTREAAKIILINDRTLENWRSLGRGPRYVKVGGRVRYRISDLLKYLEESTRLHTGDSGEAVERQSCKK